MPIPRPDNGARGSLVAGDPGLGSSETSPEPAGLLNGSGADILAAVAGRPPREGSGFEEAGQDTPTRWPRVFSLPAIQGNLFRAARSCTAAQWPLIQALLQQTLPILDLADRATSTWQG